MWQFILVCICGGLGAICRYILNVSIQRTWRRPFPLWTFTINVLAGFLGGVAAAGYAYETVDYATYLLFVTGFLGGFSTFSTFANETYSLGKQGHAHVAELYAVLAFFVPVAAAMFGWWVCAIWQ